LKEFSLLEEKYIVRRAIKAKGEFNRWEERGRACIPCGQVNNLSIGVEKWYKKNTQI
jgi:hypothetical protein